MTEQPTHHLLCPADGTNLRCICGAEPPRLAEPCPFTGPLHPDTATEVGWAKLANKLAVHKVDGCRNDSAAHSCFDGACRLEAACDCNWTQQYNGRCTSCDLPKSDAKPLPAADEGRPMDVEVGPAINGQLRKDYADVMRRLFEYMQHLEDDNEDIRALADRHYARDEAAGEALTREQSISKAWGERNISLGDSLAAAKERVQDLLDQADDARHMLEERDKRIAALEWELAETQALELNHEGALVRMKAHITELKSPK